MLLCQQLCWILFCSWFRYIEGFAAVSAMNTRRGGELVADKQKISELVAVASRTLAGDYVIECDSVHNDICVWSFAPLRDAGTVNPERASSCSSSGHRAWTALHSAPIVQDPSFRLRCTVDKTRSRIDVSVQPHPPSSAPVEDTVIQGIVALIQVQYVIDEIKMVSEPASEWDVYPPNQPDHPFRISTSKEASTDQIKHLFERYISADDVAEVVDMVTVHGQTLGQVPRKLVHQHNLLHRGIGLFVTRDMPLRVGAGNHAESLHPQPDLYVHRRTSTKRIFPALYDMFVGGVSLAGEDAISTARRELEEELGLNNERSWISSQPLFRCVVCTAYNRCVVDVFSYTMDTTQEHIQWQQEEVAWGSFVPYSIVQAAADRSIERFASRNEWPGSYPPIQSTSRGESHEQVVFEDDVVHWTKWDFVPDGLLVWESWLRRLGANSQESD